MLVEDVAAHLVAKGIGDLGVDIFLHVAPDEPDDLIVVTEYSGDEPDFVQENRLVETENSRFQIGVRGERPEVCRETAERAYQAMMDVRNEQLNGTRYLWIRPTDTPSMIGRDDSGRFMSTVNFRVKKVLTSI